MLLQNSKMQVADEPYKENEQANIAKMLKGKKVEREIVKIEDSPDEQPIKKSKPLQKETKECGNDHKKVMVGGEAVKR